VGRGKLRLWQGLHFGLRHPCSQDSVYSAVWAETRKTALTEAQYRSTLDRGGVAVAELRGARDRDRSPVWGPIVHPCWSGSMPVLMEDTAEPVPSADIEVRDLLGIGNRFG
jgi:hypothetical protein